MSCLLNYWSIVVPSKSVNQLIAERWLIVFPVSTTDYARINMISFSRWHVFGVCFGTQFCCGSLYAFVFISDALDMYFYGKPSKQSYLIVLKAYIFMGVTAALLGPMLERRGPRVGMAMATILLTVGFFVSQLAVVIGNSMLLAFGYSCLCGMGYGIAIITTISTVQKWFPDLRGLASGLCLLGFGLGNGMCSLAYSRLLHRQSIYAPTMDIDGVSNLFWSTGVAIVPMFVLCTLVIRTPPMSFSMNGQDVHCVPVNMAPDPRIVQDEYLKVGMTLVNFSAVHSELEGTDGLYFQQVRAMTLLQCILSTDFLFLYVAFAANMIPLLVFVPQIVALAAGVWRLPPSEVNAVLIQAFVGNTLGRFLAPFISDGLVRLLYSNPAFMRKIVFTGLLSIQIGAFALVIHDWHDPKRVQWLASVVTFASGGGLAIMPCFITDMFGVYHSGTIYGLILTSYSLGGVVVGYATAAASGLVTVETLYQQSQTMLVVVICGVTAMLFVRTNSSDRFFHGYQYSACGKVLVQIAFPRPTSETCADDDSSVVILDEQPPTPMSLPRTFTLWNEDVDGARYKIAL
ncbi:hypothetical protein H310_12474 [Aphanomyces invadans]|uniref:Major facilitator superfamily (MFS) profile domain-containing protein n=1 Tax=Aphanomyces invadans TaxID=157072 RepID=A0A024THS1_9STRA|nr:hypothetical protein H310_12474 [Aphanomyces invadans]ETV93710.1 hypothetical protein H310_12474 [Aphanomyces invadans]|eukprot:XP_008877751.1 hypothetical protein H310_12474 [Aphanomyces invadans]